jgi:hydrogenase maturation protein HypF
MKSTFAFFWNGKSLVGHHIGEMGNPATFERYRESLAQYRKLFGFEEEVAAYDLHPDYTATKHRHELSGAGEFVGVLHHHAHIASVIAEHGISEPVIGIAADGTGYGDDGSIWGCEFFTSSGMSFTHVGQLLQFRLPGGEAAVNDCRRTAFSLARQAGARFGTGDDELDCAMGLQLEKNLNCPKTSSLGRLFDGFSVVAGMGDNATFEAELAIKLESAFVADKPYEFPITDAGRLTIDWRPAFLEALKDRGNVSGRFHTGLSRAFLEVCKKIRMNTGISTVALSGGCFLNLVFINLLQNALKANGFVVYTNMKLPPGDGCISFGQGAIVCAGSGGR